MAVDLHIHTTASDGSLSPEIVVKKAKDFGYDAIAITDHDTIDGLDKALKNGKKYNLEVIPGIEINTEYKKHEVHILGYYIDYENENLLKELKKLKVARRKRVKKILNKLENMNINISLADIYSISDGSSIGRSHIARLMTKKGYVNNFSEAFNKYLAINKKAYVPRYKLTPSKAINLIKEANGIAVLAHPGLVNNDNIVRNIINKGVEGLEVYYYEHNDEETKKYLELAKMNNLLITGGSDDHGPGNKDGLRLGKMKLNYLLVKRLKERQFSISLD